MTGDSDRERLITERNVAQGEAKRARGVAAREERAANYAEKSLTKEHQRATNLVTHLRLALETLERVGCQFGPCPGPDEPPQAMLTCYVCETVRILRHRILTAFLHPGSFPKLCETCDDLVGNRTVDTSEELPHYVRVSWCPVCRERPEVSHHHCRKCRRRVSALGHWKGCP